MTRLVFLNVMMFVWTKISSKCAIKLCNAQSYFEETKCGQIFYMGILNFQYLSFRD